VGCVTLNNQAGERLKTSLFLVAHLENLMMDDRFPIVPKELLDALEKRFPDKVVDPKKQCPQEAYGSALVVRFLRYQYDLQQHNILEN